MSNDPNSQDYGLSDDTPGENDAAAASNASPQADEIGAPDSPPPPPPPPPTSPTTGQGADDGGLSSDERLWAMLVHLAGLAGYIPVVPMVGMVAGPLILWAIKKNEMPFVDQQGKEALNFQLTLFIVMLVLMGLSFIPLVFCITIPLMFVVALVQFVFTIIASIQANDGKAYVYPFRIEFFT